MLANRDHLLTDIANLINTKLELITPENITHRFLWDEREDAITIVLKKWDVLNQFNKQDSYGLLQSYIHHDWHTDQLATLLHAIFFDRKPWQPPTQSALLSKFGMHFIGLGCSYRNNHDLLTLLFDADFAAQWLDSSMSPSAGIYSDACAELQHVAQRRKYLHILESIQSPCTHDILDMFPAWGAFVELGLTHRFNMSAYCNNFQTDFIHRRLKPYTYAADYRLLTAKDELKNTTYDAVVSIEQLHFLSKQEQRILVQDISNKLRKGGKALVQTISYDKNHSFAQYLFNFFLPNAVLPQYNELMDWFAQDQLIVEKVYAFDDNYTQTFLAWLDNLHHREQHLSELGVAPHLIRMWRLALNIAYVACQLRYLNVHQFTLRKA